VSGVQFPGSVEDRKIDRRCISTVEPRALAPARFGSPELLYSASCAQRDVEVLPGLFGR
jgi:hypothetical protein